ncbi:MAG: WG repeat-containing protein [Myxococcota bacterium]
MGALIATLLLTVLSATPAAPAGLYPIDQDGKVGWIDRSGKVVIAATFDSGVFFYEGLARVEGLAETTPEGAQTNGKYGYIDTKGAWVVRPQYRSAGDFSEGLAMVDTGKHQRGYIDRTGALVIPGPFLRAEEFSEGRAAVETSRDFWAFIDRTGRVVFEARGYDLSDPPSYSEGLVALRTQRPRRTRFLDLDGKVALEPDFAMARDFREGLSAVRTAEGKWGYIDKTGATVIAPTYEFAWSFRDGLAPVRVASKWGYIDAKGDMVITPRFDDADGFSEGYARVKLGDAYGYVDRKGKLVIPARYGDPEHSAHRFTGGLAMASKRAEAPRGRIYIDTKGRQVWPR